MTYTTGRAQFDEIGNIQGYGIQGGTVYIEGAGMDATTENYTEIIARAAELNAKIWGKDVRIKTGVDKGAPGPIPKIAIDVKQLGGMYANKIHLIATEAGVGVSNAGTLSGGPGQFVLTADGMIENKAKIYGDDIAIGAKTLNNTGVIASRNQLQVGAKVINNQRQ
jgi:filamentous hemagglutinin